MLRTLIKKGVVLTRPSITMSLSEHQKGEGEKKEKKNINKCRNSFRMVLLGKNFLPALRSLKLSVMYAWETGLL